VTTVEIITMTATRPSLPAVGAPVVDRVPNGSVVAESKVVGADFSVAILADVPMTKTQMVSAVSMTKTQVVSVKQPVAFPGGSPPRERKA
jgi:hypothetical protein